MSGKLLFWTLTAQEWVGTFQQLNNKGTPVAFRSDSVLQSGIKTDACSDFIIIPVTEITDYTLGKWKITITEEQSRSLPVGIVYLETSLLTSVGSVWSLIYGAEFRVSLGSAMNPTLTELENLFHDFTARLFGYDIDNEDSAIADAAIRAANTAIRTSWLPQSAPPWKITEDRAFLQVVFEDSAYNKQREYTYRRRTDMTANQIMDMTNSLRVTWTFYGPNSYSNALSVFGLLGDPRITLVLEQNKVFLVPEIKAPVRSPELFSGQYWERTDVSAVFNVHVRMINDIAYLQEATVNTFLEKPNLSSPFINISR